MTVMRLPPLGGALHVLCCTTGTCREGLPGAKGPHGRTGKSYIGATRGHAGQAASATRGCEGDADLCQPKRMGRLTVLGSYLGRGGGGEDDFLRG